MVSLWAPVFQFLVVVRVCVESASELATVSSRPFHMNLHT